MGALAAACIALAAGTGCSAVVGDQEIDTIFRVAPGSNGTFFGWSEVSIDEDPNQVDSAKIGWCTLIAEDPPNADLTFIQTVTGESVTPEGRTPLASKTEFPPQESEVPLDIVYLDDIRGFFVPTDDRYRIRIEWTGNTNPAFTNWPENGFKIRVTALIEID